MDFYLLSLTALNELSLIYLIFK